MPQYLITRRFNVHISGSLTKFQQHGPQSASWTPLSGKAGEVLMMSMRTLNPKPKSVNPKPQSVEALMMSMRTARQTFNGKKRKP